MQGEVFFQYLPWPPIALPHPPAPAPVPPHLQLFSVRKHSSCTEEETQIMCFEYSWRCALTLLWIFSQKSENT